VKLSEVEYQRLKKDIQRDIPIYPSLMREEALKRFRGEQQAALEQKRRETERRIAAEKATRERRRRKRFEREQRLEKERGEAFKAYREGKGEVVGKIRLGGKWYKQVRTPHGLIYISEAPAPTKPPITPSRTHSGGMWVKIENGKVQAMGAAANPPDVAKALGYKWGTVLWKGGKPTFVPLPNPPTKSEYLGILKWKLEKGHYAPAVAKQIRTEVELGGKKYGITAPAWAGGYIREYETIAGSIRSAYQEAAKNALNQTPIEAKKITFSLGVSEKGRIPPLVLKYSIQPQRPSPLPASVSVPSGYTPTHHDLEVAEQVVKGLERRAKAEPTPENIAKYEKGYAQYSTIFEMVQQKTQPSPEDVIPSIVVSRVLGDESARPSIAATPVQVTTSDLRWAERVMTEEKFKESLMKAYEMEQKSLYATPSMTTIRETPRFEAFSTTIAPTYQYKPLPGFEKYSRLEQEALRLEAEKQIAIRDLTETPLERVKQFGIAAKAEFGQTWLGIPLAAQTIYREGLWKGGKEVATGTAEWWLSIPQRIASGKPGELGGLFGGFVAMGAMSKAGSMAWKTTSKITTPLRERFPTFLADELASVELAPKRKAKLKPEVAVKEYEILPELKQLFENTQKQRMKELKQLFERVKPVQETKTATKTVTHPKIAIATATMVKTMTRPETAVMTRTKTLTQPQTQIATKVKPATYTQTLTKLGLITEVATMPVVQLQVATKTKTAVRTKRAIKTKVAVLPKTKVKTLTLTKIGVVPPMTPLHVITPSKIPPALKSKVGKRIVTTKRKGKRGEIEWFVRNPFITIEEFVGVQSDRRKKTFKHSRKQTMSNLKEMGLI
jgi:hypothetical protein